ncbi:hypothetical protein AB0B45_41035 [Nonomuraea sp. NPDC049152]|uniref:hypothetical protein n=1 Tax=Nonomuraea sp. NPDC049152 TaxID=3154350 RepID=UPI0033ED6931
MGVDSMSHPEWWRDAVAYQIRPRSFAEAAPLAGGSVEGDLLPSDTAVRHAR